MATRAAQPIRRRLLSWTGRLLLIAAAGGLAWWVLSRLDWARVGELVGDADRRWLAGAVLALALRPAAAAARWRSALRRLSGPAGWLWSYAAICGSLLVDHVTPTARLLSSVFRARWLGRREGRDTGRVLGSVFYEQAMHEIVMGLATIVAIVVVPALLGRWWLAAGAAVLGVLFVAGVYLWTKRRGGGVARSIERFLGRKAEAASGKWQSALRHSGAAVEVIRALVRDRWLAVVSALWSLAFLNLNVLGQWAIFQALGIEPGFLAVFAVVYMGFTAGVLAGTPGGAGASEAVMIELYRLLGFEPASAAAGALLFRAVHYSTIAALGLPPLVYFELAPRVTRS